MSTWQLVGIIVGIAILTVLLTLGQVAYLMWKGKQQEKRQAREWQEAIHQRRRAMGDKREGE